MSFAISVVIAARFQSTPSARRATRAYRRAGVGHRNFNPRPPRGGRHGAIPDVSGFVTISIHALREEGDLSRGL